MQVAFYKGTDRLFNRSVSWWLNGPYSHCELVLETVNGISHCASSSFMDGGVRTKWMALNPEHWDLVDVWADEDEVYAWIREHKGQGYDILGLAGFVWRPLAGETRRWFCSEAVAAMLGFKHPWRFDPMNLYCAITRLPAVQAA